MSEPKSQADPDKRERIRSSALWAAYGDALGFIIEGVDAAGVRRRTGTDRVEKTVVWRRRVGGKFGPTVALPAGCISDDTQLRLATSRSIGPGGNFDVETFAKIELPVWLAYALGAGRGSQEASNNLRKRDVTWATNFFAADRANYLNGGGNGAAMRIQPHVWSMREERSDLLIADVIANSVATHGHPRGILGAVFHAHCLAHALRWRQVPGPEVWDDIAASLDQVGELVQQDTRFSELWLGQWQLHSGQRFPDLVKSVADEVRSDLRLIGSSGGKLGDRYRQALQVLEAFRPDQRGSGTKTAILAALVAWLHADDPQGAVVLAANAPGTDTDTIATMAGALVGAVCDVAPEGDIADRDYLLHEADRMWAISQGTLPPPFPYPSLLKWAPPKSASDVVGVDGNGFAVAGLGPALPVSEKPGTSGNAAAGWQWLDLWFGQRLLVKRRERPPALPNFQTVTPTQQYLLIPDAGEPVRADGPREDPSASVSSVQLALGRQADPTPASLHELTDRVIASGLDPTLVGQVLLTLADRPDGIESALAYVSIIVKARMSRRDRDRRGPQR